MQDHVYKITEIVGTSRDGIEQAIEAGLSRARKSIHNIRWFEVDGIRGFLEDQNVTRYQVTLKLGFTLDD